MTTRIEKKQEEIKKIERRIQKWNDKKNEEGFKKEFAWLISGENYEQINKERLYDEYIKNCEVEIKRAEKDLNKCFEQIEKIKRQEMKLQDKESKIQSLPKVLIEFQQQIVDEWNRYDKEMKVFYKQQMKEMSHHDFVVKYGRQATTLIYKTDEEIEKENQRHGETLVVNLYDRVVEKVGNIVDVNGLYITNGNHNIVINGYVKGEQGTCEVESIGCGGYNIQKYHIRTIVK